LERGAQQYSISHSGLHYLKSTDFDDDGVSGRGSRDLWDLIRNQEQAVRSKLGELLAVMDPIAFEHLIKDLLVAMGYTEVEVTAPGGDKGVDVLGRIEVGISSVREVVQAKRHRNNVQRRVLDELRGSLHRFSAFRGTIITTSDFAKGTELAALEVGAAPITLINGTKLIDLMIKHGIGVRTKKVELLEVEPEAFRNYADE
jgi:restriction system protein